MMYTHVYTLRINTYKVESVCRLRGRKERGAGVHVYQTPRSPRKKKVLFFRYYSAHMFTILYKYVEQCIICSLPFFHLPSDNCSADFQSNIYLHARCAFCVLDPYLYTPTQYDSNNNFKTNLSKPTHVRITYFFFNHCLDNLMLYLWTFHVI